MCSFQLRYILAITLPACFTCCSFVSRLFDRPCSSSACVARAPGLVAAGGLVVADGLAVADGLVVAADSVWFPCKYISKHYKLFLYVIFISCIYCPTLAKGSNWHFYHLNLSYWCFHILIYVCSMLFFQVQIFCINTYPAIRDAR